MKVTLHPGAERTVAKLAASYENEGSPDLATRFVNAFRRASQLIADRPEIEARRSNGRRGLSLDVFRYTVLPRIFTPKTRTLAVKDPGRHPRRRRNRP